MEVPSHSVGWSQRYVHCVNSDEGYTVRIMTPWPAPVHVSVHRLH